MNKLHLSIISALLFLCVACHKDEPKPDTNIPSRTLLVYAIASNNLSSYLKSDTTEMIEVAPSIEGLGKNVRVMLYSVASTNASEATLAELRRTPAGKWTFTTLKSYDRATFSTDPERMREVYADLREISPSDKYGLVFWSHGTGWLPNFSNHQTPGNSGKKKSFGADTYGYTTDYCDIDELSDAIPNGMFDYIWFDCCYMMGIEVAYQLRDKCDYIAGYPTEDWNPGMNYDTTLPMLAAPEPDLTGAADAFFRFYTDVNMSATVTVARTDRLEALATAAAAIYAAGERPVTPIGIQNYSRLMYGLYDFGQLTRGYLTGKGPNDDALTAEFDRALADVLMCAHCTETDFNGRDSFDPDIYSGFSAHFINSTNTQRENYYRTLDWYKATNP